METNEQTTNQVILVHARSVRRQSFAIQHFGIGQTFIWIITWKLLLILKKTSSGLMDDLPKKCSLLAFAQKGWVGGRGNLGDTQKKTFFREVVS